MMARTHALGFVVCAVAGLAAGCAPSLADPPTAALHTYSWKSNSTGWAVWGSGGAYLYGVSATTDRLDVWTWKGDAVQQCQEPTRVYPTTCIAPISDSRHVAPQGKDAAGNISLVLVDTKTQVEEARWTLPKGWYCHNMRVSGNGRYVALELQDNRTDDRNFDRDEVPLGLLDVDRKHISWPASLLGRRGAADTVEAVAASNDGSWMAVAGWDSGAAVVDVHEGRVLWASKPPREANLADIAFSGDNRTVYTGGTMGCVYGMETANGRVTSKWFTTESGKPVYGHRISTVAVSPDGRYVAAGTGPTGLVSTANSA